GVSPLQASKLGSSGKGTWRLANTRQLKSAMSVAWFAQQDLVSLVLKYDSLRHERNRRIRQVCTVVWEDGVARPLLPDSSVSVAPA
ncbi:MAG: hypothetical protein M3Y27_10715, partial [Acidobacteriota bacterium]|nr:hypothetical protein [Acidobacteriota bacterium]